MYVIKFKDKPEPTYWTGKISGGREYPYPQITLSVYDAKEYKTAAAAKKAAQKLIDDFFIEAKVEQVF